PYANRDPRLEQTIIHHGTIWGVGDEQRPVNVNNDDGEVGPDYARSNGGTCTGYYLKKYTTNIPWDGTVSGTDKACPIFRYAEILLNAAEALNEAGKTNDAYQYVNQVRARVGMPAYSGMSKEQLRERIQNERRIELCFEDHRYFDVRRWMLFSQPQNQTRDAEQNLPRYRQLRTIYGVSIRENTGITFNYGVNEKYPYFTFNAPKNYFVPIPLSEIRKTGYTQTKGWEM
ncbi:MAG TPA: RagB/SusD family nutrient uptake outer membrane protein, partial [Porphyromonadaceae bacterium]|nr:RagB/SusD family nutrient uptake outer membrane protein [Porphyromonadaceae bacterium]